MTREQLSAIVRLLAGIGILLVMFAFMRACFSPPQLPSERPPPPADAPTNSGTLPGRY